ncbi:phage tail tip lysozyme [Flexibacterium corallicola]|uniref:phage tail tip lysozyme n=1 Tax=Flexibacterium corallicola TaxID=3037259 RepID=UPI00286F0331|nr:phage tail tip lysozyme [Pseudovibrio sp. M1P-2-3]
MRSIHELIVHCTATREGQSVSVKQIDRWHRARGFSGIGYHFVVHLDGTISNGRALARIGAHTRGYNAHSIGAAYVGGVDANGDPKDTRTKAQHKALEQLIKDMDERFNLKKVSGHNQYSNKACPSFQVDAYNELLKDYRPSFQTPPDLFLLAGTRGMRVKRWSERLVLTGFANNVCDEFNGELEDATKQFQRVRHILPDGVAGPQTRAEMKRYEQGKPPLCVFGKPELPLFEKKAPLIMSSLVEDLAIPLLDAAAILGNLGHECNGFRTLQQVGGSAYGWAQWDGVRRRTFFQWCKKRGLKPHSDKANYGYLLWELKGSEKRSLAKLRRARGLEEKTIAFEQAFERAGVKHYPRRIAYAKRALSAYRKKFPSPPILSAHDKHLGRLKSTRDLQKALTFLGADLGAPDNVMGPRTTGAIRDFERLTNLPVSGEASEPVKAAVQAVYIALGGLEKEGNR